MYSFTAGTKGQKGNYGDTGRIGEPGADGPRGPPGELSYFKHRWYSTWPNVAELLLDKLDFG